MTRRLATVQEAEVFHQMLALQLLPLLEILLCELLLLYIQEQHHAPIHACMGMSSRHVLHNVCDFVCVCSHVWMSRQVHPIISTSSIDNHCTEAFLHQDCLALSILPLHSLQD